MNIPEYISTSEVQRVCRELGLRDWTQIQEPRVTFEEAQRLQDEIGAETMMISTEVFRKGLEVELEHGIQFPDANVTNNHPLLTGLIVLAHLKEMLDYYQRLEIAELEGDMWKALKAGDADKLMRKFRSKLQAESEFADRLLEPTEAYS